MSADICPIWGTPATFTSPQGGGIMRLWNSPRAGGRYALTPTTGELVSNLSIAEKIRVTNWIVDQNRLNTKGPTIESYDLERVRVDRDLTVTKRRDRLLMYIRQKVARIGDGVPVEGTATDDYQLAQLELLAWTASEQATEFYYLIKSSVNSGLVELLRSQQQARLTTKGYDYLQQLESTVGSSEQAFVAMWFHTTMEQAYEEGFQRAIFDAGYRPVRIDRKEHINKIDDEIVAEIRHSRFLVADFTSDPDKPRGGVYFEAGFAYGLNIPVIWTCREDQIEYVHFDTRQFNHIVWSTPEDLCTKLKNRIEAVIGDGPL